MTGRHQVSPEAQRRLRVHHSIKKLLAYDFSYGDIALLLATNNGTIHHWAEQGEQVPPWVDDKLQRIIILTEKLRDLFDRSSVPHWLLTPHPRLGGRSPDSLLNTEEGLRDVERLIESIKYGTFA